MATTTPNYDINYDDPRFQQVETDKNTAMSEFDQTYQGIIDGVDEQYKGLQDAIKQNAETQKQNQQANTDFTIQKIEQQKDQTRKDYLKEQSGAYQDYVKQSNRYGVNAEQMAASGMTNTGYSESSQVAMYNQYQNRVATAREVLSQAILNYDNNMKEAMLQNNSILAEIEANAALESAKLALEGFQYKNNLILEQANKKIELDNIYYNRWQDVLTQMNTENAMKFETDQAELNRQHDFKIQEIEQAFEEKMAKVEQDYKIAYLNAQTEKEKELIDKQHEKDMAKLAQQLANEKAFLEYQNSLKGTTIGGGGGGITAPKTSGGKNITPIYNKQNTAITIKPATTTSKVTDDGGITAPKTSGGKNITPIYNKQNTAITTKPATTTSKVTDDKNSLVKCGLAGRSPSYIANLVAQGKLMVVQKNNKRYYHWNPVYKTVMFK